MYNQQGASAPIPPHLDLVLRALGVLPPNPPSTTVEHRTGPASTPPDRWWERGEDCPF